MATGRCKQSMQDALEEAGYQDEYQETYSDEGEEARDEEGLTIQQRREIQGMDVMMSKTSKTDRDGIVHGWGKVGFGDMTDVQ